jgi:hypothetical protein
MSDILISIEEDTSILIDKSTEPTIISNNTATTLQSFEEPVYLITTRDSSTILQTGIVGPAGPTGPAGPSGGEDEVAQAKRVDFTNNDTIIYKGEAVPGTTDASALWRVRRLTIAEDNDVVEEWADGTSDYIKIWNNRYTYTYS